MQQFEDIVYAGHNLEIGLVGVHHVAPLRELHQHVTALILGQEGVVLVGQFAPKHLHAQVFPPLQTLQQWNAVEDLAVQIPAHVGAEVAVVEELHVVDEIERLVLHDVAQVGGRHDEQRIRHLVPLRARLDRSVYLAPRPHPETFVDACLREVVVVFATKESLESHGVANGEHRRVEVDGQTALLGVDIGSSGSQLQLHTQLRGAYLAVVEEVAGSIRTQLGELLRERGLASGDVGQALESHSPGGLVALGLHGHGVVEPPLVFPLKLELLAVVEHHLIDCGPLECREHVILVGMEELV